MAGSTGKKSSTSQNRRNSSGSQTRGRKNTTRRSTRPTAQESALFHEIGLIVLFVIMVFLFLCNFGILGLVGNKVSGVLFGLFGLSAYGVPVLLFLAIAFWYANEGNAHAIRKLVAGIVLFLMFGVVCDLISGNASELYNYTVKGLYTSSQLGHNGGGAFAGSISYCLQHYIETIGTVLVVILCSLISIIVLTEKSILDYIRDRSSRVRELSREDAERRREINQARRAEQEEEKARREEERAKREEERRLKEEEKENERILRIQKKAPSGVQIPTLTKPEDLTKKKNDVHEITYDENAEVDEPVVTVQTRPAAPSDFDKVKIKSVHQMTIQEVDAARDAQAADHGVAAAGVVPDVRQLHKPVATAPVKTVIKPIDTMAASVGDMYEASDVVTDNTSIEESGDEPVRKAPVRSETASHIRIHNESVQEGHTDGAPIPMRMNPDKPKAVLPAEKKPEVGPSSKKLPKKYTFPPISILTKGMASNVDNTRELHETAQRLEETLRTFHVEAKVTEISEGPSVTRYELTLAQGIKVSKVVGLADDIKLSLAATDIRIEAPIPGKSAIGIEVPNKVSTSVAFRDLLESKQYSEFNSKLAFAVGKDIAGQVVVFDIAKMPHVLIAGATGSGKSVCINTIIMSILYKAKPDEVNLIMIDPKVVELSVYNGIPHLIGNVVTDPKLASQALKFGVSEMENRYRAFADYNVRDLKGYNAKIEEMEKSGELEKMRAEGEGYVPTKLPQIVIIVDELADLMMVCPGEVEESICRLAQLARAAGIHLILATQRPSVDVITGLIKANMPSRIAFSVSSGVDSRTILDMNGAEKLLGKGDMLFYPQGYTKPARIQGAFVSDNEVFGVVEFLKNLRLGNVFTDRYSERMNNSSAASGSSSDGGNGGGNNLDDLFEKAGRAIIDKDKASIGMLQRILSIGFNRAARIMDQLCEYGVVGEEEGTKPRKILMSPEQFEQLIEEIL